MSHVMGKTHYLPWINRTPIISLGKQKLKVLMRSCTLKPWRICVPGDIKQIFLAARSSGCIFELGGIAKYLVTGPTGFFSLSLLLYTPTQKMVLPWGTLRVLGT